MKQIWRHSNEKTLTPRVNSPDRIVRFGRRFRIGSSDDGSSTGVDTPVVANNYEMVSTGVDDFFDDITQIPEPSPGVPFFGQDAKYPGIEFSNQDNGGGMVTDLATGLMWQKAVDGFARNWEDALAYAEGLELPGYDDWRLPNVKELQSIVDYTRDNPAINPIFDTADSAGWFWSSTTSYEQYDFAMYVAFGKATDYMGVDVHGAVALRSDPKSGDPSDYPFGHGPQNDEIRVYNYVRAVRNAE